MVMEALSLGRRGVGSSFHGIQTFQHPLVQKYYSRVPII